MIYQLRTILYQDFVIPDAVLDEERVVRVLDKRGIGFEPSPEIYEKYKYRKERIRPAERACIKFGKNKESSITRIGDGAFFVYHFSISSAANTQSKEPR